MDFLKRHWRIIGLFWLAGLLAWGLPRCFDSWQLKHRQNALLEAIEQRHPENYAELVSSGYQDAWGFDHAMIGSAMDDVSAQFLALKITPKSSVWVRGEAEAEWTVDLELSGQPVTPIGEMMLSESRQLQGRFTFRWRREGWGAWTWKLVSVSHPNLAVPPEYIPGSLSQRN